MIKIDYYSKYVPEPGIEYYNDDITFIIWEGYFDELFRAITQSLPYEQYPIEFREYNDITGWKDDDTSTTIKPENTIVAIKRINKNHIMIGKEFIKDLNKFLTESSGKVIKIREYW